MLSEGALEDFVELRGAEARAVAGDDFVDAVEDFFNTAATLRGDEFERRVGEELQLEAHHLFEFFRVVGRVLADVPLIDEQ